MGDFGGTGPPLDASLAGITVVSPSLGCAMNGGFLKLEGCHQSGEELAVTGEELAVTGEELGGPGGSSSRDRAAGGTAEPSPAQGG